MYKITSYLSKPSTYVLLFLGAVVALAVPFVAMAAKPVADLIPGSKSKGV